MTTPSNIFLLHAARGVRGFGDGFAIIILPAYLTAIGYERLADGLCGNDEWVSEGFATESK
jgi:hypothetical protein